MNSLRIVLADDHTVVREGLALLIDTQEDMRVVAQADGGRMAIHYALTLLPDVIVLDVSMPDLGGAPATAEIKQECPQVRVLALTRHDDQGYMQRLLQAGADGYILKKTPAPELISAIRVVAGGGTYIDPRLAGNLVERWTAPGNGRPQGRISLREEEVLRLIAWGWSNKEIAAALGISVKTVEYYKANATDKLGLQSRTDIVRFALAAGWLHEDTEPT
jgi:DNA-binding NarL/FixJ family response regulator